MYVQSNDSHMCHSVKRQCHKITIKKIINIVDDDKCQQFSFIIFQLKFFEIGNIKKYDQVISNLNK